MWIFRDPYRYVHLLDEHHDIRDTCKIQVDENGRFFVIWNTYVKFYLEPNGVLREGDKIDNWTWEPAAKPKCTCCERHKQCR